MATELHHDLRDGVAILTLDRPIANALAPSLRKKLSTALDQAFLDDATEAIVLCGAGSGFSSGVDIQEYDGPLARPWVGDLCNMIENAPKPVVAALHGSAIGAGIELALAAHGRVAQSDTRIAFPEVTLGLIPGSGGTQRLPRLIGAQLALELMLSGQLLEASDSRLEPVFDKVVGASHLEEAMGLAKSLAAAKNWVRTCDRTDGTHDPEAYWAAVESHSRKYEGGNSTARDIVKCVEAAQLLPFELGLEFEKVAFEDRIKSPQARAQLHVYVAERRANVVPEAAHGRAMPVDQVIFLGASAVSVELAIICLDAGQTVTLLTPEQGQADEFLARVEHTYDAAVKRGKMTQDMQNDRMSRLSHSIENSALARADLVFDSGGVFSGEAGFQSNAQAVWVMLDAAVPLAQRAEQVGVEGRAVALRAYRPAHSTALAEIAVPEGTDPDSVATIKAYFTQMGRAVVRSKPVSGLLGHNLIAALYQAALCLVQAGQLPYRIDIAVRELGFASGAFQMMDEEGLDLVLHRLNRLRLSRGLRPLPGENLLAARIEAGAEGRASGFGFYRYQGSEILPDPGMPGWLEKWRATQPDILHQIEYAESGLALLSALANEAAKLVADNVAARASDLDVIAVKGYGFDRARGGPLFMADEIGMLTILGCLQDLSDLSDDLWHPHPMIEEMVKYGRGFFSKPA